MVNLKKSLFGILFLFSMLLILPDVAAQTSGKSAAGVIVDVSGEPLVGVSVLVKGTTIGSITDLDGKFSIPLGSVTNPILKVSYIGYDTQEIPYKGISQLRIVMAEGSKFLEEVVVVGYGTMRKSDLTGSVSSVSSKDITQQPVANIGEALQGRASGVSIISSGAPGSNVSLKIRGLGTTNNSDPLLVIDGVPTEVPLNTLNMDDVATVDILKDASATAIYGSRGANGVVLITTKKGKAGESVVSFKASYGFQDPTNMPKMLNATQFATLHNEMMLNNNQGQNPAFADPTVLGQGTNWLGALFETAPMQNYSLSYSGGDKKTTYYVSGGVLDQKGIVLNTGYRRYTLQFNSESKVFDWLNFGNKLTLNHDVKKEGSYSIRETMAALPTQSIYNPDGSFSGPTDKAMWAGDIMNPIGKASMNKSETKGYNVLGNIFAEISLFDGLKFKSLAGLEGKVWDTRSWTPKYDWKPIAQPESYLYRKYNKSMTYLWDNYFTYNKTFNKLHHVNILVGTSAQNNVYDYLNGSIQGFISESAQQINNGTTDPTVGGSGSEWALLSFMSRVNYTYADKYLLTATVRRDGSSRFGSTNRWGTFPSFSAAWRLSEEKFFNKTDLLSDMKLRFGFGITGNQNVDNYSFASVFKTSQYAFNNTPVSSLVPVVMPNPDVRWEEVQQTNIGVDLTLFKQRVNVTLDGYIKNTNDMLVPMSVPISTGYSDIYVPSINAGQVQNKGLELSVTTQNMTGKFEWSTTFNASLNTNKILDLNSDVPMYQNTINMSNVTVQAVAHPINSFYGFVTDGIFQTQEEVDNSALQVSGADPYNRTSAGDIKFKDLNNDGVIDDGDRTYIGNPTPEWNFALNNTFRWKGFDLEIFFQGIAGNEVLNANRIWQEGMAVAQNQNVATLNRWTGEGSSNSMPRAIFNDPNKNTRVSNRFIEDGSYLRLKNLSFGYSLPKPVVKIAGMSSARVYISCQNLLTITSYSGFDPEVSVNGIDNSVYPLTRTLSIGANIIF